MEDFHQHFEDDRFGKLAPRSLDELQNEGYSTDMYQYIDDGWTIFKKNPTYYVLFTIITVAIGYALSQMRFGSLADIFISPCLWAGIMLVSRKFSFNQTVEFTDFFEGFKHWERLVPVVLVGAIFTVIGLFLLVIPGIYLAVSYMFIVPLVLFYPTELALFDVLEGSRKVVSKKWMNFLGLLGLLLLINLVGLICLGVGLLVSIPVSQCAIYAAYEDIFGVPSTDLV